MANVWRNIEFGARLLRKNPGFAFVAILALALGIGANTAIFSVVYGTLLARLPYHDPERMVSVWSRYQGNRASVSPADYLDWKRESTVFEDIGAFSFGQETFSDANSAEVVPVDQGTPSLDKVFDVPLLFGRSFLPEEGELGKDRVVVLSYIFWKNHFGDDRNILGRTIRLDGENYAIVGVERPPATDRIRSGVSIPLAFKPADLNHEAHFLLVQGHLKPGVTIAQANAEMQTIGRDIAAANPTTNKGWEAFVEPREHEWVAQELRSKLYLLMGAVGFVLLIACANVANLLLARGTVRRREVAVRTSLGATRWQLAAQFLTESGILAFIGAALGVGLAWGLLKVVMAVMPPYQLPTEAEIKLQVPVLLFTLAVTIISAIVCGLAPIFQSRHVDLNETLKDDTRSATGAGGRGLRRLLVIGEISLALTLLAAAGLAMHGFWKAASIDLGFRRDHILTFWLPMDAETRQNRFARPEQINSFYRQLLARIEAVPGVEVAQASLATPVMGARFGAPVTIVGQSVSDPSSAPGSNFAPVTPGFFKTFGLQLDRGRFLTEADMEGTTRVAVVNQTFVKRFLHDVDPLSQRISMPQFIPGERKLGPPLEWQIVGVYRDARNHGLLEPDPEIEVSFWQSPWPSPLLAVRTANDPETMTKSIAAAIRDVDASLPMAEVQTIDEVVRQLSAGERFGVVLFGSFAAVGLMLAVFGVYGVMAFTVAQRTREIGLRIALGAGHHQILRLFLSEGVTLGLIGLVIGESGAYAVGRLMRGMWYGTAAGDPIIFFAVAGVLLASAVLACYIPARQAAKVDPMVALRYE